VAPGSWISQNCFICFVQLWSHSAGNSCLFGFRREFRDVSRISHMWKSFRFIWHLPVAFGMFWACISFAVYTEQAFFGSQESRRNVNTDNTEQPRGFVLEQIICNKIETDSRRWITLKAVKASLMHLVRSLSTPKTCIPKTASST
jgi:hypothetical protein